MTPDRWTRIERLFAEVAPLDADEREAVLDREARTPDGAPDPALREEVERLLALDAGADDFFDGFAGGGPPTPGPSLDRVGPWKLLRKVGEGGMGEVYEAVRDDGTYRQRAAVKLVRPGLAPDLVARFRAERHVLARLEHPAIARLLDGGTAPDGRPYLATEFVDGEPITAYCDRRRLSVNERLALFGEVCEAVAAAHRQLVVHRDLKPSNVLVASGDSEDGASGQGPVATQDSPRLPLVTVSSPLASRVPRVKLLDFGIAKLLDAEAAFTVPVTVAERRVLTPEYAAPEQVRGEPPTTATDVYGLGVLLYELLTGARPYRIDERVRRAVEQAILDEEPTEPSTAVTGASEAAAARATEPQRLRRRLRGDLDRIVLKALRKEPGRRYDGPAALRADLDRHLAGLPVEARPESVGYRVGRFVRRHRAGVAAAVIAILGLVGGLVGALVQAEVARDERDRAEAVTDLLVGLFDGGDPAIAQGDTLTALALLDSAAARLAVSLADDPGTRTRLQLALSRIYTQQGAFERADSLLAPALAWSRQSGDDGVLADALFQAGEVHYWLGRYAEGETAHRDGLLLARRLGRPPREIAERTAAVAIVLTRQGEYDEARALHEEALALLRSSVPPGDPDIGRRLTDLGILDEYAGAFAEAEARHHEALDILVPALGENHPDVVMTRRDMARAVAYGGRPAEAAAIAEDVARANRRLFGEDHPTVANTLSELARYYRSAGDLEAAERASREGLRIVRQIYPGDHQYVANGMLDLALVYRDRGDLDAARPLAEEALRIYLAVLGEDHPFTGAGHGHLAHVAALQGDRATALRHEREALRIFEAAYGTGHPRTDTSRVRLKRLQNSR